MSELVQFERLRKKAYAIDPNLKAFIDRVVVPILLKEYLSIADSENDLAPEGLVEANFVSSTAAPAPGQRDVRP